MPETNGERMARNPSLARGPKLLQVKRPDIVELDGTIAVAQIINPLAEIFDLQCRPADRLEVGKVDEVSDSRKQEIDFSN